MVKDVFSVTKIRQHRHQNVLRAKVDRLVRVTSQVRTITMQVQEASISWCRVTVKVVNTDGPATGGYLPALAMIA
jgi:hypothetical protein